MKRYLQLLALIVAIITAAACRRQPTKLDKFDFLLDWQAEPTYLGVYYAKDLGLFAKIGLDVNIIQSWGANQAVAAVAGGRYQIATASGGATVLAYNNDAHIVSLAVLYPRIPTVVYGLAKSGIQKPKDLEGRRVGIYPQSITKNEFDAFVKIQGLNPSRLNIVSLSGADIPLLLSGQVDAVLHYTEMSPVLVSLNPAVPDVSGKKVFELRLADYGVGGYGLNVVTSREALEKNGDQLRSVSNAVTDGYRIGCAEPVKAVDAFAKLFPDKDKQYITESWRRVCGMVGNDPGSQNEAGWSQTIALYKSLGLLTKEVSPKSVLP